VSDDAGILPFVKKKPNAVLVLDRVELQARLIQCAGTMNFGLKPCETVSAYVGWALAPAEGGRRTNVTLFGVCKQHLHHRQGIEAELAEQGFVNAHLVPYSKVNEVIAFLEEANLLRVA
jgi:hypothetical protein